jgi:alcohol dehydrogenase (cytochrome c)
VDARSGKVSYRPGMLPKAGVPLEFCPDVQGVRNWPATAYHPDTRALYIPIQLACQKAVFTGGVEKENLGNFSWYSKTSYTGYEALGTIPHPASPDHRGGMVAVDVNTGRVLWQHATRTKPMAAALTTAGDLVVSTDSDGHVYIHDVETGKVLYETRLPSMIQGFPITYAVHGRQYLAVPTGSDQNPRSQGVNAMFVFALPERAGSAAR